MSLQPHYELPALLGLYWVYLAGWLLKATRAERWKVAIRLILVTPLLIAAVFWLIIVPMRERNLHPPPDYRLLPLEQTQGNE